jgi:FtsP/CotA-like multicopper oxidase with cupredoxin domain
MPLNHFFLIGLIAAHAISAQAKFDIPTGAPPSPLFGAQPFTQQMLLFEELGLRKIPTVQCPTCTPFPAPLDCESSPVSPDLDAFLSQALNPLPTLEADIGLPNPWATRISQCLGRTVTGVLEGRPPGANFGHQRFQEFFPQVTTQSAQAGARANRGLRDHEQSHGYNEGEFGPGGLYHNTTGNPGFDGTTKGIAVRFHPNFPVQEPNSVWTFDGTLPPKLIEGRLGDPILFRHYDALPIDTTANNGFGLHTLTTHLHNGHNGGESDGYPAAFFFPGEFYDYHWPMILAGHDRINTSAADPRAGAPDGNGGIRNVRGDYRETMSTHWFHDHMLDFTAQNVYKGNVGMFNIYSSIDRGREPVSAHQAQGDPLTPGYSCNYANPKNVNLCLPSGSGLDFGNRDYDVNLVVADKAWDQNGQLFFNIFNLDGFLADQMTVNTLWKPYFEVRARRYRFRVLNGSVSRFFKFTVVDAKGKRVPIYLVANDGNIMEHSVLFPNAASADLPEQSIGERYDIVIDFSAFREGDKLYVINTLEHEDGKTPKRVVPLAEVLGGKYNGDPAVGKFLEFRVRAFNGVDRSMNPADYVDGKKTMIPLPTFSSQELARARQRTFEFGRSNGTDREPWTIKTDGGEGFTMDPHRDSVALTQNDVEVWHIRNGGNGWAHPVHIHFEEGQILKRNGLSPPAWERFARKDMYRIGPLPEDGQGLDVALRFRDFFGTYVEHCHNTQHEDHSMMLRWDIDHPGQLVPFFTPIPTFDGVLYEDSFVLPPRRL